MSSNPYSNFPASGINGFYLVNYQAYVRNIWLASQPYQKSYLKTQPKFRPIYVFTNDFETEEEFTSSDTESIKSNENSPETMSKKEISCVLDEFIHNMPPTDGYIHSVIDGMVGDLQGSFSEISINK